MTQLKTTRASDGAVLQNLAYTYDPVGNITEIKDSAQQKVFFDNDVVRPEDGLCVRRALSADAGHGAGAGGRARGRAAGSERRCR